MAAGDISLAILITAQNQASSVIRSLLPDFTALQTVMLGIGATAILTGVEAVKMAANFQSATTTLVTGAGESARNLDMIRQGILNVSMQTGQSTQALTAAMFTIESAGFHGAAGLQLLQTAAQGAAVGNANMAQVADVLTTTLHNYGMAASQAVPVTNSLIVAVQNGKMTMDNLNAAMTNVLPVAGALHVPLASVEGALSTMAIAGDKGASAGTHLAMMLKMLSNPASTASKEMQAMGINSVQLAQTMQTSLPAALQMIQDAVAQHFVPGSVEYNRAIATILGGSKSGIAGLELMGGNFKILQANVDAAAAALRNGGNSVQGWSVVQGNLNTQLARAKAAFDALVITVGTMLLPVVTAIVQNGIIPLIQGLITLVSNGGSVISFFQGTSLAAEALKAVLLYLVAYNIVMFIATFPEIISGLTLWASAAWAAAAGMTALDWPILLIAAAVAALIAVIILLYQHWTIFHNLVNVMGQGLQALAVWIGNVASAFGSWMHVNVLPILQALGSWITGVGIPALHQLWDWLYNKVGQAFSALGTWISGKALPALQSLGTVLRTQVGTAFQNLGTNIQTYVMPPLNALWNVIQTKVVPAAQSFWQQANTLWTYLQKVWSIINQSLQPVLQQLWQALVKLWNTIQTQIVPVFNQLWTTLQTQIIPVVQTLWDKVQNVLIPALKSLWTTLQAQIIPVLQQLWNIIQSQIIPALTKFWGAIQPILPDLKLLAMIIIGSVVIALTVMVSTLAGVVGALTSFVTGLTNVITGVKQFCTGIEQLFTGAFTFISGLLTGNTAQMTQGWNTFSTGFENITSGMWKLIQGVWQMSLGALLQGLGTFIHTATGLFQSLSTILVGHSIIPDMVNAILAWFQTMFTRGVTLVGNFVANAVSTFGTLPGRVMGAISGLAGMLAGFFGGLANQAISWGRNIIQNLINGITSMIGNVAAAAQNVASTIAGYLGFHSPTELGPGRDADKWAPAFIDMYTQGLLAGVPRVQAAFAKLTNPMANGSFSLTTAHNQAFALSGSQPIMIQVQPMAADITLDGRKVGESVTRYQGKAIKLQGGYRNG